jgi:hypothetical protein
MKKPKRRITAPRMNRRKRFNLLKHFNLLRPIRRKIQNLLRSIRRKIQKLLIYMFILITTFLKFLILYSRLKKSNHFFSNFFLNFLL